MSGEMVPVGPIVRHVRGVAVILDADLAAALGLETMRLNESVKRHADLIDERHRFQLSRSENDSLISQTAISNAGRGGRRTLPWVYTERGVARVTTFISTPEAIRAADLIIDTFLMVQHQVSAGQTAIAIQNPARYLPDPEAAAESRELGKRMLKAINGLLDTVIDIRTGDTISDTAKDLTARALENVRERLREKGLENLKLEAEISLILVEAEKAAQEVEGKKLENLEKRIDLVQKLIAMHRDLAPVEIVQLLDRFEQPGAMKRLAAPAKDRT